MKIAISGGHFSPAYSIIKKLEKENEILVLGRKYAFEGEENESLEYKLCKKESIPFIQINAGRLQRVLSKHTLPSLFRFPKGIFETAKILKKEKPDVVLTFGGYLGLTVSIAAEILSIPVVLHEQTQKAGLSSKIISKFSRVTCISFASSKKYLKGNIVLTGNPIREEIFKFKDLGIKKDKPLIYITGGSTGSHAINNIIYKNLEILLENFILVHQTGNSKIYNDFDKLEKFKKNLPQNLQKSYHLKEFFEPEEVGWLLHNCHLVISRSGANTITELLKVGCVSLLIPLPHGQSNEQLENAKFLKNSGLGEYIEQKDLNSKDFVAKIFDMIKNREKYLKYKSSAQRLIEDNATENIIEQIFKYGRKRKGFGDSTPQI